MLTPSSKGPSASTARAQFANRVSLISASLGFYRGQLVVALPGSLDLRRRTQPGLERAAAGEPFELSVATGDLPCSFTVICPPGVATLASNAPHPRSTSPWPLTTYHS